MKKQFLTYLFLTILSVIFIPVKGQDTLALSNVKKENLSPEPIAYDQNTYDKFKKDKFYNYYEVRIEKESILDNLYRQFAYWLARNMGKTIERKEFDTVMWIIGIIFLIVIIVILYINKPGIFYINKKNALKYSIEEEDIHGHNFDNLIKQSLSRQDYSDAIRWQYLKTLKGLHEKEHISYDFNKTVNEYVYEIKDSDLRKIFKKLSLGFIYYRYGKGEADENKFLGFEDLSKDIIKTIKS